MALEKNVIFDNIHGYITLNRVEDRILQTAYYQRLKWIKQLGFSFQIFPGATHTRFSHTLGVMHVMDKILNSIGKAVPDQKLYDSTVQDKDTKFHRTMRLAGMLHDIGTFPFSHTVELAYINHWKKQSDDSPKYKATHENLGVHIIQNTNFEGGITKILLEEGIDPKELSEIISGKSKNLLANQLMHSDVDADRMDYLIRDAYHTGVKYGTYDQDYLIQNLTCEKYKGKELLAVHEHAMQVVEYFLICRYTWYSQIIADGTGYKFDLIAAKIYEYFLEMHQVHSFKGLIDEVTQTPNKYFTFNDSYFLSKIHTYLDGENKHPVIKELCEMLTLRRAPKHIRVAPIQPTLIESPQHREALTREVKEACAWFESAVAEMDPDAWVIKDIPKKDVTFTYDPQYSKDKSIDPILSRDVVKVVNKSGELKQITDVSNSLLKVLRNYRNFIPRLYVSPSTYEKLEKNGIIKEFKERMKLKKAS